MDYKSLSNTSNATDFGDTTAAKIYWAAGGGSDMAVAANGDGDIDYIANIASTGNAASWGSLGTTRSDFAMCSNGTRGLISGGNASNTASDIIEYFHFDTIGSTWAFGNLSQARWALASTGSDSRALYACGTNGSAQNTIDYNEYATPATSTDFGNMQFSAYGSAGCSDNTYAAFSAGWVGSYTTTMKYVTIDTPGNSQNFGDLSGNNWYRAGACSNGDTGVWGGGRGSSDSDVVNYRDISNGGSAYDMGDLTVARSVPGCCSGN
tara:strand:- start:502 stop:1296 length:795 start_codon:yes stop_codon:yes gene_type:complete